MALERFARRLFRREARPTEAETVGQPLTPALKKQLIDGMVGTGDLSAEQLIALGTYYSNLSNEEANAVGLRLTGQPGLGEHVRYLGQLLTGSSEGRFNPYEGR